jgi:hypothetical protein
MASLVQSLLSALGTEVLSYLTGMVGGVAQLLASFLFQTADPTSPGRPFTQLEVIRRLLPLVQVIANAGLTAAVIWGSYRTIWMGGSTMSIFSRANLQRLVPRLALAALLINTALPLIQLAIDANNAICLSVAQATRFTAVDFLFHGLQADLVNPGPTGVMAAIVFVAYALLGASYVVRFALLVVLVVLSPVAALLFVLPETQHWAHQWGSLFVGALFSQPLQLLVLALGMALDAYLPLPFGHLFGLATIYICFRIPGALHSTSAAGRRALSHARREVRVMTKAVGKAL